MKLRNQISNFFLLTFLGKNIAGFSTAEENVLGTLDSLPDCGGLGKSCEEVFVARGANYSCAPAWQPHVQVDGTIFTGQNPASAAALGDALVKYFAAK